MTVKELKEKLDKLPEEVDDLPINVYIDKVNVGVEYLEILKVYKVGTSKEDIKSIGLVTTFNGNRLKLE